VGASSRRTTAAGTYERLKANGVTFLTEPVERPYGVEAVFRDDSGNWFSLTNVDEHVRLRRSAR